MELLIEKVQAFRTTDGKVFESPIDAEIHVAFIYLSEARRHLDLLFSKFRNKDSGEMDMARMLDSKDTPETMMRWGNAKKAYDILICKKNENVAHKA